MRDRQPHPFSVELRSVTKIYQRRRRPPITSVDRLSLAVPAGQICGFLGPNGAGKTTTIKMICGLITPSSGQIMLNGQDLVRQRRGVMQQLGVVLEGTRNIYWRLSAGQNLLYFGRLKGCSGRETKARAADLLQRLELWDRRHDPVGDFSRGMQQKVALAVALIHDPQIVLLDEPTLGLDVYSAKTVKDWVLELAQLGKTVILTSHELDMVQEVCERVAIIHQGRLVADKPVSDLLGLFREEHYEIRIGTPLPDGAERYFPGLKACVQDEVTTLSGAIANQTLLHQILSQIHALQLPLISVNAVEPSLEEVFMRLTNNRQGSVDERNPARDPERSV
jgi:ABC-2 type transport system ATP-binding protein